MDEPRPYTARAIKATALLEETRALLRAWQPGESPADLRNRARREDLLGKATSTRRDDIVQSAFIDRFLIDGNEPAASLRSLLEQRGNGPWFKQLCLLAATGADRFFNFVHDPKLTLELHQRLPRCRRHSLLGLTLSCMRR